MEVLLRGHLWLEFFLEQLISASVERPDELGRMGWRDKLSLCGALGVLSSREVPALAKLNKLRNDLAHDLRADPSERDIDDLVAAGVGWKVAINAVREVEKSEDDDIERAGGEMVGDDVLLTLQCWFLVVLMDLEHRAATVRYDKEHQMDLARAAGVKYASKLRRKPMSQEEAERDVGLPPRPQPGDAFRVARPSEAD